MNDGVIVRYMRDHGTVYVLSHDEIDYLQTTGSPPASSTTWCRPAGVMVLGPYPPPPPGPGYYPPPPVSIGIGVGGGRWR